MKNITKLDCGVECKSWINGKVECIEICISDITLPDIDLSHTSRLVDLFNELLTKGFDKFNKDYDGYDDLILIFSRKID